MSGFQKGAPKPVKEGTIINSEFSFAVFAKASDSGADVKKFILSLNH